MAIAGAQPTLFPVCSDAAVKRLRRTRDGAGSEANEPFESPKRIAPVSAPNPPVDPAPAAITQEASSQFPRDTVEHADSVIRWLTSTLPEARSIVFVMRPDGITATVIAGDVALRPLQRGTFSLDNEPALEAARATPATVHHAYATAMRTAQIPWSATIGEQRSAVAWIALPAIAPEAVLAVFYAPPFRSAVDEALASLPALLAGPEPLWGPDPRIYQVIHNAKREWERTVDSLKELVFLLNRDGKILRANRAVERWGLGDVCRIRGSAVHAVIHATCPEQPCRLERLLACRWKQSRATGSAEFEFCDALRSRALHFQFQRIHEAEPVAGAADSSCGVLVVADVTDLHVAQRGLRQLNDDLELRVQARTEELQSSNRDLRAEIARREDAERNLQQSRDELVRLSAELLQAQERERARISLELHDSVGQSLGALKYSLERLVAMRSQPSLGDADAVLASSIKLLQRTIHDTRAISTGLRPSLLDDMGVISAVQWLCRWFRETYVDIRVSFETRLENADVPEKLATSIFRIVQEALNNAAKHSKARNILIVLRSAENTLALEVIDDGAGFETSNGQHSARPHLGIAGMRERANMTGGKFTVVSGAEVGTHLRAEWPATPRTA